MKTLQRGNYRRAWKTIMRDIQTHAPETLNDIPYWEDNRPVDHDVEDFYQYYVWAVYNAGMAVRSLDAIWGGIAEALCDFSLDDIVANLDSVRDNLQLVNRHTAKMEAVLEAAVILHEDPHNWTRMKTMAMSEAVTTIRKTFRYVGPQNTYHIVRNLGWDVPTHSGFTLALSERIEVDCDTLIQALCKASGLRPNTTDILLGVWSRLDIFASSDEPAEQFVTLLGL